MKTEVIYKNLRVPEELHHQLRVAAAQARCSITDFTARLLSDALGIERQKPRRGASRAQPVVEMKLSLGDVLTAPAGLPQQSKPQLENEQSHDPRLTPPPDQR